MRLHVRNSSPCWTVWARLMRAVGHCQTYKCLISHIWQIEFLTSEWQFSSWYPQGNLLPRNLKRLWDNFCHGKETYQFLPWHIMWHQSFYLLSSITRSPHFAFSKWNLSRLHSWQDNRGILVFVGDTLLLRCQTNVCAQARLVPKDDTLPFT